jgi:hypothetical protein
MLYQ